MSQRRLVTILAILGFLLTVGNILFAQIPTINKGKGRVYNIYLKADTITVKKGFEHLDRICSGTALWQYNRYVIKNDTTYLRFGITVFKKVYRIDGKKYTRVKEYEL